MIVQDESPARVNGVPEAPAGTVTNLVGGILDDAKQLAQQQLSLFKTEVREDFHNTIRASQFGGAGIVFTTVGAMSLLTALVYLLHEQFQLSMSAAWAILGTICMALGVGLALACNRLIHGFNLLPDKTLGSIKETLTWTHKK